MLKLKHRLLSGLMSLVMVLSLVPMMSFVNDTINDTEIFAAEKTRSVTAVCTKSIWFSFL